jgi:hypothetical protein
VEVARIWLTGQPLTQMALAHALGATRTSASNRGDLPVGCFVDVVKKLEQEGVVVFTEGGLRRPWIWNWTGRPVEESTLAPAVAAYLTDPGIKQGDKGGLRTALRKVLPEMVKYSLPKRAHSDLADGEFVKAADLVSAFRILEVLRRARETRADGEYGRQVSLLLKYAAARRLIAMVFPTPACEDEWDAYRDRIWPTGAGAPARGVKLGRAVWNAFKAAAISMHGPEIASRDPGDLSPQEAMGIIRYTRTDLGWLKLQGEMQGVLLAIRDDQQAGPFRTVPPSPFTRRGAHGRIPTIYLTHPSEDGRSGRAIRGSDFDDLLVAIEAHGLPVQPWRAFLLWYRDYCLLSPKKYKAKRKADPRAWPVRPVGRRIKLGALRRRYTTLRLFLGTELNLLVVEELPEDFRKSEQELASMSESQREELLGAQEAWRLAHKATLTPETLLGKRFEVVLDRATEWWEQRAAFAKARREQGWPEEDNISHESSGGIHGAVVSAGLIALALYDRMRVGRKADAAPVKGLKENMPVDTATRHRGAGVDVLGAFGQGDQTSVEHALLTAYRLSTSEATEMMASRVEDNVRSGNANTRKSHVRMLEQTPAEWWYSVYQAMLSECETLYRRGGTLSGAELLRVAHTFTFGVFLSTGSREGEAYGAEIGRNFKRETRAFDLDKSQRKNERPLFGKLHTHILPDWLLDFYLDVVRSALVAQTPKDCRRLLVNSLGRPMRGANALPFLEAIARTAVSIGFKIPAELCEFGEHAIRLAMGHWVRVEHGREAAADFLGDSVAVVDKTYSVRDARRLDVSGLQRMKDILPAPNVVQAALHAPASVPKRKHVEKGNGAIPEAPHTGYSANLLKLIAAKDAGWIDDQEFAEAKADLRRVSKV